MSGVHRVDLVRFILGDDFTDVQATTGHYRGRAYDDTATVLARLTTGASCTFQFGLDAPYGDDRIAIHGSAGTIFVDTTMSQWWSSEPGSLTLRGPDGVERWIFENVDNYVLQVEAFARFTDGDNGGAFADANDGVAAAQFTEGVYAAATSGRTVSLTS